MEALYAGQEKVHAGVLSARIVFLWFLAAVFPSPVLGQGQADYYPIENGGGATVYCYSGQGLQLTTKKYGGAFTVTSCIHARNAPVVTFPAEGGSSGSAYCKEGAVLAFHASNGKLKACTISYPIKGLNVSGVPVQCAGESITQFSEDGHIVSCGGI